ncbi:Isopenicillin N synthase [Corchorus olitorius]|uniref:Isopenicillin N synthase n=1 Tax=Corchorus olitorius TaxID=93759 RepID=A0A1R3K3C7_9ROSI|nr:Isopenicillin N synthase [Corchorus olitorius]
MGEVDPAFIQELEHRPKLSTIEAEGIPLIDLSVLNSADAEPDPNTLQSLVSEIGNACKEWGFFQIINHGVSVEQRQKLEKASREFFAQPLEEKVKVRRDDVKVYGYYDGEHTKNVRDWKEVFDFTVQNPTIVPASKNPDDKEVIEWHNQWPDYPPELKEACEEYSEELEKLAFKLMELIALSLGLPPNKFHGFFKDQTSFIRLNHYPPCPAPDLALGVGRHKDAGALTILNQDDVGGLEVKRKSDGEWIRVKPTPDAFIINVGDIIQVWSNETYESVEHRVAVNSERERFSIPFFFNPAHYTNVKPLEELTRGHNVTAIDLAGSGVDPQQVNTLTSISDYIKPLRDLMESLPDQQKVVLVGHSLGGLAISQAMERFPHKISVAVFVTALMPGPTLNISTLTERALKQQNSPMDNRYTYDDGPNKPPTTFVFGPIFLSSQVYQLSPPQDWTLASMLMRPIRLYSVEDMSRELVLSEKKYGSVNRVFIISDNDMVSTNDLVWWMIHKNPPQQVEEVKGSDHMVMMSQPI